jgi:hypothetical protein
METTPDSKIFDRPTDVIRDAMRNGKHPVVGMMEDIPGGLTEIAGAFNPSS